MLVSMLMRMREWFKRGSLPTVLMPPYPIHERECPDCGALVYIWRTHVDGTVHCVECSDVLRVSELGPVDAEE